MAKADLSQRIFSYLMTVQGRWVEATELGRKMNEDPSECFREAFRSPQVNAELGPSGYRFYVGPRPLDSKNV